MKVISKITLVVIAVLLLVATFAMLATPAYAAEAEFKWEHFGVDPYATSREEGMRTREDAFRKLGFSEDVVAILMIATEKSGEKVRLVNGDKLDAMLSKGGIVHRNVTVAFVKPPKDDKMEFAAPAEKWEVSWKGTLYTVFLPEVCNNWSAIIPKLQRVIVRSLKPIAGSCPNVYHLKVYVYQKDAIKLPGVAQTMAKEEMEEHFVYGRHDPEHVSRTHYTQFQKALAAGELRHSTNAHVFRVSLIMTPESAGGEPIITEEISLGEITVKDTFYEISLLLAQIEKWDAIRIVPIEDGRIQSPPRYHKTGLHEMRFFFHLPNTKHGEWDSNPDPDCVMGEAWIER